MSLTTLAWTPRSLMTHVGRRSLPSTVIKHPVNGTEFVVYDTWSLFPDLDAGWKRPLSEISGFVAHHDAVAFSGADLDFDGHRSDEELARLKVIYQYHLQQAWNGIGYHAVGGLEDRIYVPRQDVLETHRAHTSTSAAAGTRVFPEPGAPVWNRQLLGYCEMGNYSDRRLPDGTVVAAQDDRWSATGLEAMDTFNRVSTVLLGRAMTLRAHKHYQVKECCGDWTTPDSWHGFRYPASYGTPATPPREIEVTFRRKYVVRAGDTLGGIALRYDVTVDELMAWNRIPDRNRIELGQELYVEAPKAQPSPQPSPGAGEGAGNGPETAPVAPEPQAIREAASLALSGLDVAKKQLEDIARIVA